MALDPVTAVIDLANGVGSKLIDKIWPDKTAMAAQRDQAALALLAVQNDQEIKIMTASLSAIVTEAQSQDPWTSRARPTFMYVIYILILTAFPMGVIAAFRPDTAVNITHGMTAFLNAIPDSLWALFGTGYLGYTGARSWEKSKGITK